MKVLNLDKVAPMQQRKLVLAGVSHVVNEMTVANFIETTRVAEKMANETSVATQIEETVEMIIRTVPTATKEVLGTLSLEQLHVIAAFIRGDDIEGVETVEEGASAEGAEAGK
jgi:hypothetical protein